MSNEASATYNTLILQEHFIEISEISICEKGISLEWFESEYSIYDRLLVHQYLKEQYVEKSLNLLNKKVMEES